MNLHFQQNTSLSQQLLDLREICNTNQQILIVIDNQFLQQKILEILDFQHDFFTFLHYIAVILHAIEEEFSKESLLILLKLLDDEFQMFHMEQNFIRTMEYNGGLTNLASMMDAGNADDFTAIYNKVLAIKNEILAMQTATFSEFLAEHQKVIHINCGKLLKFDNFCCKNPEKISLQQYQKKLRKIIPFFQNKNLTISNKINDFDYDLIVFFNVKNVQLCSKSAPYIKNVFGFTPQNLQKFLLYNVINKTKQLLVFFQDFSDLPITFKELYYGKNVNQSEEAITCKTFEKADKKLDFNQILQHKNSFHVDEFLFAIKNPHTFWYCSILKFKKAKKITKRPQMRDLQRIFLAKIAGESPKFFAQYPELMCIWEKKLANLQQEFDAWKEVKSLQKGRKFTCKTSVNNVEIAFKFQPTFAAQHDANFFDVRIVEETTQRQHAQIIAHLTQKDEMNFQTVRF